MNLTDTDWPLQCMKSPNNDYLLSQQFLPIAEKDVNMPQFRRLLVFCWRHCLKRWRLVNFTMKGKTSVKILGTLQNAELSENAVWSLNPPRPLPHNIFKVIHFNGAWTLIIFSKILQSKYFEHHMGNIDQWFEEIRFLYLIWLYIVQFWQKIMTKRLQCPSPPACMWSFTQCVMRMQQAGCLSSWLANKHFK